MKRWFPVGLLLPLLMLFMAPTQAAAYSYGDANAEEVAETFKLVAASLAESSPNWKAAEEAYKVRRSEISSHFGEEVALTLDNNFQAKDVKLVLANFKAVLVMNLDRRFTYAKDIVADYTQSKLLLAKARATFETLEPYMNLSVGEIKKAFDEALVALGNPGLFGVGKKEAQPEVFKQKINFIYSAVKPLFPYKAYLKPTAAVKPNESPVVKPAEPTKVDTGDKTVKPNESPRKVEEMEGSTATATPDVRKPDETATTQPIVTMEPDASGSVKAPSETAKSAAHAPMTQTKKTNPFLTIFLIGGVLIFGLGGVWFARKKGLF